MLSQRVMPTILVVDDYEDTRRVMRMWLQRKGYRIVEATDGLEAVAQAGRESPDLILMDIEMPELDGLSATRRIRAQEYSRTVPIIALSAYGPEQYRPRALEAGCTEYLSAPFSPGDLERLISSLLAEARA